MDELYPLDPRAATDAGVRWLDTLLYHR